LYMKPMSAELGWTRSQLSLGVSTIALVSVFLTPIAGALIDRIGTRPLALVGAVAMPIGLYLLSHLSPSYSSYVLLSVYMGVVATAGSPMTYAAVLPQWIDHRLGRAIALSMVGLGVGQMLNSAATSYFIAAHGWRAAWMISALVIGPLGIANCVFLFRDNPAYIRARREYQSSPMLDGLVFGQAIRHPVFWLLGAAAILVCTVAAGISTHSAAILTDRGASTRTATIAVMLLGLGSLSGRLLTGLILDHVRFAVVGGVSFALQAIGMVLLWMGLTEPVALVAMFLVGLATGAEADIIPFAIRRTFGMRAYGKLFGIAFALYQLGPVFGAPLMGASFDRAGSYAPMLAVFAGFSLIAAIFTILAGSIRLPATHSSPQLTPGV
jgi:predicted MFS family arabinose efflux permease